MKLLLRILVASICAALFAWVVEERARSLDKEPHLVTIDAAGVVRAGSTVLYDPAVEDEAKLVAHFREMAEAMPKVSFEGVENGFGPNLPTEALSISADARTPAGVVARVIAVSSARGRYIWKFRLRADGAAPILTEWIEARTQPQYGTNCTFGTVSRLFVDVVSAAAPVRALELAVEDGRPNEDGGTDWHGEVAIGRWALTEPSIRAAASAFDALEARSEVLELHLSDSERSEWQDVLALLHVLSWKDGALELGRDRPPVWLLQPESGPP